MSDRSEYSDTGNRGADPREGFGDDMGTRVGRPDGAAAAPHDASPGAIPGHVSTNTSPVTDGLEGSIEEEEGPEQQRVQRAAQSDSAHSDSAHSGSAQSDSVNPPPPAGGERRIDDL